MDKKRMEELDRLVDEAIEGEVIQLSPNIIQARLLLCVIRAGTIALVEYRGHRAIAGESVMFDLINTAYHEQVVRLKEMMQQFDDTVGKRMKGLSDGLLHEQLVEILGKDIMDVMDTLGRDLTTKKEKESD